MLPVLSYYINKAFSTHSRKIISMKNISQIMYNTFYECSLEQSVFLSFKSPQKLAFIKLKIFFVCPQHSLYT